MTILEAFKRRLDKGQKCFIPFITAGDPTIEKTAEFILAMSKAGADVIEIGVPFSDPAADGPVIMAANNRALDAGTNIHKVFDMLAAIKDEVDSAMVFLIYANLVYKYGIEAFFEKCKSVGVSGTIIADVPVEEESEFRLFADKNGVDIIRLIAPTSKDRVPMICDNASGFLYCVSSMGVTGVREEVDEHLSEMFGAINQYRKTPTAVGFGISKPEHAKIVAKYADGVIVGSALVNIIAEYGNDATHHLTEFVTNMRIAVDE